MSADQADAAADDAGIPRSKPGKHIVTTTWLTDLKPKRVRWMWQQWISCGTLTLLSGREGSGKSTFAYFVAAAITRGELPGVYEGKPRAVLVVATEDSMESTIVPRLLAHGANMSLVARFDVKTPEGFDTELTLPDDLDEVEARFKEQADTGVPFVMAVVDPLISRLSSDLDSHKDAEVRVALEPLVALADRNDVSIVGLIHLNKGKGNDPLQAVMASAAFPAVARQVLMMGTDPQDRTGDTKLIAQTKSNLGRRRAGTEVYEVENVTVGTDEEGDIDAGQLVWKEHRPESIEELLKAKIDPTGDPMLFLSAVEKAAIWLRDYLEAGEGRAMSSEIFQEAKGQHSEKSVRDAAKALDLVVKKLGFQGANLWILPEAATAAERSASGKGVPAEGGD